MARTARALSWTLYHVLDEKSPLYGLDENDYGAFNVSLVVVVTGYDVVAAQTIHARRSYDHTDIRFGQRYADIIVNTVSFPIFSSSPQSASPQADSTAFESIGAPLLQAICCGTSRTVWSESARGLSPTETASQNSPQRQSICIKPRIVSQFPAEQPVHPTKQWAKQKNGGPGDGNVAAGEFPHQSGP